MFEGERILVTGGTGSWGHELIRQLLPMNPEEVVIYSRSESSQVAMSRLFQDSRLKFVIGDVRDRESLTRACEGIDILFHLAALKHVPVCEEQPYEALKTNVLGTQNVIEAAIAAKVKKVINISTDKAANPSNFYGMTKAIGEKLTVYANLLSRDTRFVCVRGGNALGASGSVIHLFMRQIQKGEPVQLTDRRMTRFFMTMQDAIRLLFDAAERSVGGEIFVMMMPTCRIADLAEVLMDAMGRKVGMIETGIRPGEKIHEVLLTENEAANAVVLDEKYLVIMPSLDIPGLKEHYATCPPANISLYSSSQSLMGKGEIRDLLIRGGFLI
jgi:FlaA1/EpsC-like NDP-sugar epimerase